MADEPNHVSEDERDHHEIPSLDRKSGKADYVLVGFAQKQRCSYYAGKIVQLDCSDDDDIQTCFLTRTDMRKDASINGEFML
ncbi:hypothetical protein LSAT2_016358, partial [Lamellibrachia satsuma]